MGPPAAIRDSLQKFASWVDNKMNCRDVEYDKTTDALLISDNLSQIGDEDAGAK